MAGRVILGSVLSGLALFGWQSVSWMLLPWHNQTILKFGDEPTVSSAIFLSAQEPGVYMLPCPHRHEPGTTPGEALLEQQRAAEQVYSGPFMFAAVSPKGMKPMALSMGAAVLINIAASFLVALIIMKSRVETFTERLALILLFALAAGVVCHLPYWNWWGFPAAYTGVAIADLLAGWLVGGAILAKILPKPRIKT